MSTTNRPLAQAHPVYPTLQADRAELVATRLQPAQARYVLPSFVERTSYGI